jgi:hypothetical protein
LTQSYSDRAATFREEAARESKRVHALGNSRLAVFVLAVALLWFAERGIPYAAAATFASAAFIFLVTRHRRARERLRDFEDRAHLCDVGMHRQARDWSKLPVVLRAEEAPHSYTDDLDIFGATSLSQLLGPVRTHHGAQTLRRWLAEFSDIDAILERQAAVRALSGEAEFRESVNLAAHRIAPHSAQRVSKFLDFMAVPAQGVGPILKLLARGLPLITMALMLAQGLGVLDRAWWLISLLVSMLVAMFTLKRMNAILHDAFGTDPAPLLYARTFAAAEALPRSTPVLEELHDRLRTAGVPASQHIARLERIMQYAETRHAGGVLALVLEAMFLWSVNVVVSLERWQREAGGATRDWFEALGEVEALTSLATLAHDEPQWCFPEIDTNATTVAANDLGHPMLRGDVRITNDVTVGPRGTLLLITGSNMSGKSTLLRSIGSNTVLAQAGAPVCARQYSTPLVSLYTSINVRDSLASGVSLYMAQLKRLKEILNAAALATVDRPCLYLLDEILSGTNSADRTTAVRAVVLQLLEADAIGALTTHDLALAVDDRISAAAHSIHFTETIDPANATMSFDYRIRPGVATSTNALELMRLMGIRA